MAVRSEAKVLVLVADTVESNPASDSPDSDSTGMISLKQASLRTVSFCTDNFPAFSDLLRYILGSVLRVTKLSNNRKDRVVKTTLLQHNIF